MPTTLFIQERVLSSWSLRGHLLMEIANVKYTPRMIPGGAGFADRIPPEAAPARTVPAMLMEDGRLVWDTLAIAETLAEEFPEAPIWPKDKAARAFARAIAAEMHGSFGALRGACPMNISLSFPVPEHAPGVLADMARIETLWAMARGRWGAGGPWLFGAAFTAADAFYAPVAARFLSYGLPISSEARGYCDAIAAFPAFRRWRAMGLAEGPVPTRYDLDLPKGPWPGPAPLPAKALSVGERRAEAISPVCPFSGEPVADDALAEIDGKVVGFCNPFHRDKAVADAEAWPQVTALLRN